MTHSSYRNPGPGSAIPSNSSSAAPERRTMTTALPWALPVSSYIATGWFWYVKAPKLARPTTSTAASADTHGARRHNGTTFAGLGIGWGRAGASRRAVAAASSAAARCIKRALKSGDGSIGGAVSDTAARASRSTPTITRQRSHSAACCSNRALSSPSSTASAARPASNSNSWLCPSTGVAGIGESSERLQHLWQGLNSDRPADAPMRSARHWQYVEQLHRVSTSAGAARINAPILVHARHEQAASDLDPDRRPRDPACRSAANDV